VFGGWQSFYQMTGEAAATLIGLLFIVASLTSGRPASTNDRGVKLFTTPTVFHLASVLVISALALAPDGEGRSRAAMMLGWAFLSFVYTAVLAIQIRGIRSQAHQAHWTDPWWYGVAPSVAYLALAGTTALAWARIAHATYFAALCLMVLLLVAIRNAWDLVTWLAPRRE
jgi:hypothetical protein